MEIASYTVLIAAAQAAGDPTTEEACRKIIAQEHAMAAWMLKNLPAIASAFLARSATPGVEAKV
ncbi:ferritin-like metal-binding protein YciE [Duganella sp. 1224]|nr:ferritin-like metal-binding protein YciE [Duganella sp. 1224]